MHEIRFVGDMQRLELRPGDSLVVHCERPLTDEMATFLRQIVEAKFPNRTVLVLSGGLKLGVISEPPA